MAPRTPEDTLKSQAIELAIMVDEGWFSKEVAEEIINRSARQVYDQSASVFDTQRKANAVLKEKCEALAEYKKTGYQRIRNRKPLQG